MNKKYIKPDIKEYVIDPEELLDQFAPTSGPGVLVRDPQESGNDVFIEVDNSDGDGGGSDWGGIMAE